MNARTSAVAVLLFLSGACALVFQVAWMRGLHLVFGASTAANAAVLAIFMGGLGLGSAWLGRRADRHARPLMLYGNLLIGISVAGLVSPYLIHLIRVIYISTGGQMVLGVAGATAMRLVLAVLVLGVPTVLMGGTLPAAGRAVTLASDVTRRHIAVLYGLNTLGAVAGAFFSTFYLIERFGIRNCLWIACLVNLGAGLIARHMVRLAESGKASSGEAPAVENADEAAAASDDDAAAPAPTWLILGAAATVGFAFFLMEMVWYRMLGPLLGGSTYTFGLILAVALSGIGLGGWAYSAFFRDARATLPSFALTCALEALLMAVPFALGDRLALLAAMLRQLGGFGFYGDVLGWAVVAGIVILPAAFISGVQFPLLIALLGRAREHVGRQIGYACAVNTIGAIIGSLAGGFGLLPLLSATGCWKVAVLVLAVLGVVTIAVSARLDGGRRLLSPALGLGCAVMLLWATGPTAAWRHSPIGAGRVILPDRTVNGLRNWTHAVRRSIVWQAEGLETSVAIADTNSLAFIINGKIDGNAVYDAGTQIMLGLVGSLLHPEPASCFVVGLGTGESAGWLAEVETMQTVDVVELEPALDEMARRCSPINFDVLNHPKVNRIYNDAREVLLTTPRSYDLIISEPSNPYRAGIATLFTQEFYQSVRNRLNENGFFLQWLQAYEIDTQTVRTVLATLKSVFPEVQVWQTKPNDMLLICSNQPVAYDVATLRARIRQHPYDKALLKSWRVNTLEGVLSHFVADTPLPALVHKQEAPFFNTDDRNRVEYGFARTVGRIQGFAVEDLRTAARDTGAHRPSAIVSLDDAPGIDWARVEEERLLFYAQREDPLPIHAGLSAEQRLRGQAMAAFYGADMRTVAANWSRQPRAPENPTESLVLAYAAAHLGQDSCPALLEQLQPLFPGEAMGLRARFDWVQGRREEALAGLLRTFAYLRTDPWTHQKVIEQSLMLANEMLSSGMEEHAAELYDALAQPFAMSVKNEKRMGTLLRVSNFLDLEIGAQTVALFEPHVSWTEDFLGYRYRCYSQTGHPDTLLAERDLLEYLQYAPVGFDTLLKRLESR